MTELTLPASNWRCHGTGRDLRPGERYYGVLLEEPAGVVRRDYSAEAWPGPPSDSIGHWIGRVPVGGGRTRPAIDDDMLMDCFRRLEGAVETSRVNFRYIVALLLLRRKRLKPDDGGRDTLGPVLWFRDLKGDRHEVRDPQLSESELEAVQDEVFRVIGWN